MNYQNFQELNCINDQLRRKFKILTEDYDSSSNNVYKRFLQYIWDEYKNIREVRKMSKRINLLKKCFYLILV